VSIASPLVPSSGTRGDGARRGQAVASLIKAISLDLDDTLWPIEPCIVRAEAALDEWLREHCPSVAARFSPAAMRAERDRVWQQNPHLTHDLSALRRMSLADVFAPFGFGEEFVERAMTAFSAARNRVDFYPETLAALDVLAARYPLASLTNGNADLDVIGIGRHFRVRIYSRDAGCAKPDRRIFERTATALGIEPRELLHVGDDPWMDVEGARGAGCPVVWLDRGTIDWPGELAPPTHRIESLDTLPGLLADWR